MPETMEESGLELPPGNPAKSIYIKLFPRGSCIVMGEQLTPDGPCPYISLSAPGQPPSLTFYVDPVSYQPIMKIKVGDGYRILPIDKIIRDPRYEAPKFDQKADEAEMARLNGPRPLLGRILDFFAGRKPI